MFLKISIYIKLSVKIFIIKSADEKMDQAMILMTVENDEKNKQEENSISMMGNPFFIAKFSF